MAHFWKKYVFNRFYQRKMSSFGIFVNWELNCFVITRLN